MALEDSDFAFNRRFFAPSKRKGYSIVVSGRSVALWLEILTRWCPRGDAMDKQQGKVDYDMTALCCPCFCSSE